MAECPSRQYADQVKTASGLTLSSPWRVVANEFAYGEWHARADELLFRAHAAFRDYTNAKPDADWTAEQTTKWEQLRDELFALDSRMFEMPGPKAIFFTGGLSIADEITAITGIAEAAACMWEKINEASASIGGTPRDPGAKPPEGPPGPMSLLDKAITVAAVVGGGFLAVSLIRMFQNRKGS